MNIRTINKYLLAVILTAFTFSASAQSAAENKKSADFYFKTGNYFSAAAYYQAYLATSSAKSAGFIPYSGRVGKGNKTEDNQAIIYRMAESFRLYHDYTEAEKAYAQLKDNKDFPDARYWYAVSLRANGKYTEAGKELEEYLRQSNAKYADQGKTELKNLAFIESEMKKPSQQISIQTLPTNQSAGEPVVYVADEKGNIQKIDLPATEGSYYGPASLSADNQRIYLTVWNADRTNNKAAIYYSDKNESGWLKPSRLNSKINMEGYSAQQPFISRDGKYLAFASDRPGGMGGFDIWVSAMSANGEPGEAVHTGRVINTSNDDVAPFYHTGSGTLVFSSNGRVGMGGMDLYSATGNFPAEWHDVKNLGYPLNSNKDDINFSSVNSGKLLAHAFLSSDRNQGYCMAAYSVSKQYPKFIQGSVTDCSSNSPLGAALVSLNNLPAVSTNATGGFGFEQEKFYGKITASKEGYEAGTSEINSGESGDTLRLTICLKPVPSTETEKLPEANKVYFEFAKSDLSEETKVFLDTMAAVMSREPKLKLIAVGFTDKMGSDAFNQQLSEARAFSVKEYLVSKGISESRIEASGKGDCCGVMPEIKDGKDDPEARQLNRRVEFTLKLIMQ